MLQLTRVQMLPLEILHAKTKTWSSQINKINKNKYIYIYKKTALKTKDLCVFRIRSSVFISLLRLWTSSGTCHLIKSVKNENVYPLVVKNLPASAGAVRRGFDPWVRKIPWRRAWQPTPVFLPGEFYGPKSLVGYRVGHN